MDDRQKVIEQYHEVIKELASDFMKDAVRTRDMDAASLADFMGWLEVNPPLENV